MGSFQDPTLILPSSVDTTEIKDGAVTNAKVNATAAIAMSKLSLAITNTEVSAAAAIAGSKLQLLTVGANAGVLPSTGLVDAHVAANAAIARSKIETTNPATPGGAFDTTYQNSTGKTKLVVISFYSTSGNTQGTFYTDGSNPPTTVTQTAHTANANYKTIMIGLVKAGDYYKFSASGSNLVIDYWREFSMA